MASLHPCRLFVTRVASALHPPHRVVQRCLRTSIKPCMSSNSVGGVEPPPDDTLKLHNNLYFGNYADKIEQMQRTSPEEFLSRLSALVESRQPQTTKKLRNSSVEDEEKGFSVVSANPKSGSPLDVRAQQRQKKLSSLMKLEMVKDKTKAEIADIWRQYHANKEDAVAAVIPADMFEVMSQRFQQHKTFLFPLPRPEGYEFIVVQFDEGNSAHFTTLLNYQAHKEYAPECLTIAHYTDLVEDKDIVLIRGDFDKNILSPMDADWLGVQLLQYYGFQSSNKSSSKLAHLERFTYDTDNFYVWDLIAELENGRDSRQDSKDWRW